MTEHQKLKAKLAEQQRLEAANRCPLLTPTPTYVNAAMRETLTPIRWNVRACDNKSIPSLPMTKQLQTVAA